LTRDVKPLSKPRRDTALAVAKADGRLKAFFAGRNLWVPETLISLTVIRLGERSWGAVADRRAGGPIARRPSGIALDA